MVITWVGGWGSDLNWLTFEHFKIAAAIIPSDYVFSLRSEQSYLVVLYVYPYVCVLSYSNNNNII